MPERSGAAGGPLAADTSSATSAFSRVAVGLPNALPMYPTI